MSSQMIQTRLGVGACIAALFLAFLAIPNWVSSPSNVSNIVLAPTFWSYVLTAFTGLTGFGLILAGRGASALKLYDNTPENSGQA